MKCCDRDGRRTAIQKRCLVCISLSSRPKGEEHKLEAYWQLLPAKEGVGVSKKKVLFQHYVIHSKTVM